MLENKKQINMKRIFCLILSVLILTPLLPGQTTFENKQFGFSMQKPVDWIVAGDQEIVKNLEKFEFTDENFAKLLNQQKGSILLAAFQKYDPQKKSGLIPTIQINVRSKNVNDFQQFKNSIILSTNSFKNYFENYEFLKEPAEIEVSGIKSIFFVSKFTMKIQNGQDLKVRSRTYAIPYKNYFFQVNFTDGQNEEDCTKEFDELVKTIKIG